MKQNRRIISALASLTLALAVCPCGALAAETDPATVEPTEPPTMQTAPTPAAVYPAEVRSREENGAYYLEKVYCLTAKDDPAAIPTGDFEREGRAYTLLDILKNDQTETDTKDHIEVITLNTDTKDMAEIIKLLEPELEVSTEDGYTGTLTPDYANITVEAAGYKNKSWTVSAQRTYPNLSDADISLVPKRIEDGGRTLTLANVDWQEAAADPTDGYDVPIRYTAVASYTGKATGKYATGYTVTVDYGGEVTKTSCDTVIYTAVFTSHGETPNELKTAEQADGDGHINKALLLIPAGALLLGGAGYGGWRGMKYYKDKKRGYVK